MKTDTKMNFTTTITNIVLLAQLLISTYQDFTDMRWEAYH